MVEQYSLIDAYGVPATVDELAGYKIKEAIGPWSLWKGQMNLYDFDGYSQKTNPYIDE